MIIGLTEEQLIDVLSGFFIPGTVSSGEELRTAIAMAIVSNNEAINKQVDEWIAGFEKEVHSRTT